MSWEDISIAGIQETKLNSRSDLLRYAGFNVICKDRKRDNGGALAFMLHNTVQYRFTDGDIDYRHSTIECQGIVIPAMSRQKFSIFTIILPVTCCPRGYHPNIGDLLRGDLFGTWRLKGAQQSLAFQPVKRSWRDGAGGTDRPFEIPHNERRSPHQNYGHL